MKHSYCRNYTKVILVEYGVLKISPTPVHTSRIQQANINRNLSWCKFWNCFEIWKIFVENIFHLFLSLVTRIYTLVSHYAWALDHPFYDLEEVFHTKNLRIVEMIKPFDIFECLMKTKKTQKTKLDRKRAGGWIFPCLGSELYVLAKCSFSKNVQIFLK